MKQLLKELKWFFEQKIYVIAVTIAAVCGYGYSIVQPIVGIDDTAIGLYFDDGLAVVMGRWTLFLLNKLFRMSDFTPFMMEFIGAILLCIGATLFCVLIRRIVGERIGIVGYTIFTCIFITNPIISEVNVYYLHNGVDLAYILTAVSLLLFMDGMEAAGKAGIGKWVGSMLLIWLATGCCESMMIVYIIGLIAILFMRCMVQANQLTFLYMLKYLAIGALLLVGAIILRSLVLPIIISLFHLENMIGVKDLRSITEALVLFGPGGWDTFIMLVKRYWLVYFVNAFVYFPVAGYVLASVIIGVASVVQTVKKKNFLYLLLFAGMMIAPFLLTIVEAHLTWYRSCQYMPFFTAFGMLLLYWGMTSVKKVKYLPYVCVAFAIMMTYNQAVELNKNFYVDYKKYENTKDVLLEIAWEIEKEYGSDIPVVFAGHYDTPYSIVQDYYVSYGSTQYRYIALITDLVDPHLKEKYFDVHGYSFIGEANNPFIQWGLDAFDGTNRQLMNFLEMHGHSFPLVTDVTVLESANAIAETMPGWPAEGSIAMQNGYILVHIE